MGAARRVTMLRTRVGWVAVLTPGARRSYRRVSPLEKCLWTRHAQKGAHVRLLEFSLDVPNPFFSNSLHQPVPRVMQ
jgi:hypothetical protein